MLRHECLPKQGIESNDGSAIKDESRALHPFQDPATGKWIEGLVAGPKTTIHTESGDVVLLHGQDED